MLNIADPAADPAAKISCWTVANRVDVVASKIRFGFTQCSRKIIFVFSKEIKAKFSR
ncbi:MAG: hypothetical protein K0U66_03010 [Gammaproteobacteria bacterium]|nr:hypothetical protein [Gammaproteobacteria bacterium]